MTRKGPYQEEHDDGACRRGFRRLCHDPRGDRAGRTFGRGGRAKPVGGRASRLSRGDRHLHGLRAEGARARCSSRPRSAPISGTRRRPRWRWRRSTRSRPAAPRSPSASAIRCSCRNPATRLDKPVRAMREFTEALRKLWTGEAVHMDGEFVKLAGARLAFKPKRTDPDLYRRHGAGHAAACRPHRRRRRAVGRPVDRLGQAIARAVRGRRGQGRPRFEATSARRLSVLRHLARPEGSRRRGARRSSPS